MECRENCAACCIAPSIFSPIPGMPGGKPAGIACIQLDENMRCKLFNQPNRPAVCNQLNASSEMCGSNRDEALLYLINLEEITRP